MAITFSASASEQFAGVSSSRTLSITVASGDTRLVAGIFANSGSSFSASYDGNAMTLVTSVTTSGRTLYVYYLTSPSTGTKDITFNWTGNISGNLVACTWQGDDITRTLTSFASASNSSVNHTSITGTAVLIGGNEHTSGNSMSAGTGSTLRVVSNQNSSNMIAGIFDSNGNVSGSITMAFSASGSVNTGIIVVLPDAVTSTINDTITVTDTQNGAIGTSHNDTVSATDSISSPKFSNDRKTSATWVNDDKTL